MLMSERYSAFVWKKTLTSSVEDTAETPGAVASCIYHSFHPAFRVHQISTNFPSRMKYIRSASSPVASMQDMAVTCVPSGIDPWSTVAVQGKFVSRDLISIPEERGGTHNSANFEPR